MGVDLVIIGNHSIPFKNGEIEDKAKLIELLDSLDLDLFKFIYEIRKKWSSHLYSWKFLDGDDRYTLENQHFETKQYDFEGPFGLLLYINKYYFEFNIGYRESAWFMAKDEIRRDEWRKIIYEVSNVLGGDYVMYFPDNLLSDFARYYPGEYSFPKEMAEHFKTEFNDLDEYIEFMSREYAKPVGLAEGDREYMEGDKHPFIIDRFEDIGNSK